MRIWTAAGSEAPRRFRADNDFLTVRFAKFNRTTGDRKELARQLHAAVEELKKQTLAEEMLNVSLIF